MELLLGLLLLVALHVAKTPHPTGLKPEPEPEPQPPHVEPHVEPTPAPSVTPHGGGPPPAPAPYPVPSPGPAHPSVPAPGPVHAPAKVVPASWPQAVPKELPAWPAGWEPDTPVPAAEVARAKALISELWKSGKPGAHKTEQTAGKWVTYVAFVPKKGMKGVAAFRVRPGAQGGTTQA